MVIGELGIGLGEQWWVMGKFTLLLRLSLSLTLPLLYEACLLSFPSAGLTTIFSESQYTKRSGRHHHKQHHLNLDMDISFSCSWLLDLITSYYSTDPLTTFLPVLLRTSATMCSFMVAFHNCGHINQWLAFCFFAKWGVPHLYVDRWPTCQYAEQYPCPECRKKRREEIVEFAHRPEKFMGQPT